MFVVAVCAAIAASSAQAAADHFVQAFVDARGNGATQQQDTGQIDGPIASAGPLGFHVADQFGSFDSDISATAAYGHLFGQANAAQQVAPAAFPRQSDVNADLVKFQDRLTLTSPTLAVGTFVSLNLTVVLNDRLSSGPTTCCSNVGIVGTFGTASFGFGDQASGGQTIDHQISQVIALNWFIGAPNDVFAVLSFDAGSSPGCCFNFSGGSRVDLADAQFFISLPGDVQLLTASGANYLKPQTSVPEPGTSVLLALGGVSLLGLRRRLTRAR